MNNVTLIGRLVNDPELKSVGKTSLTQFTLAVDKGLSKSKKDDFQSQGKATADFPRIKVWGKQAENCSNYLAKGRLVAISGRLETGSYEKEDGSKVYTTDINAFNVQFLEWGDKNSSNEHCDNGVAPTEIDEEDDVPF